MTTDPSTPDTSLLEEIVLRFEQAWQRGDMPDPAAFIGQGADVHLIAELVHVDLERRLKLGEAVSVEGYLERFPVLAQDPERVKDLREAAERLSGSRDESQLGLSSTADMPQGSPLARSTAAGGETAQVQQLGRFRIVRCLGEGAFGRVYQAHDPLLDRDVALKVAKLDRGDAPQRIKRFLREAKVAANLRHPHIVPLYEFAQEGDQFFIASAFIRGRTLKDAIDEEKKSGHEWDLNLNQANPEAFSSGDF
jgi:serine/threonine-protein kinase